MTSPTESPRQTPLRAVHERLGATMTSFAGWQMPLRYASETAEHLAVRRAAGLFDLSHMGEIAVAGRAAHGQVLGGLAGIAQRHLPAGEGGHGRPEAFVHRVQRRLPRAFG